MLSLLTVLSPGFSEAAHTTHLYAPFPKDEQDYTDVYDYESDSDLDDESDTGEDGDVDRADGLIAPTEGEVS